jgi:hypothetical protein
MLIIIRISKEQTKECSLSNQQVKQKVVEESVVY